MCQYLPTSNRTHLFPPLLLLLASLVCFSSLLLTRENRVWPFWTTTTPPPTHCHRALIIWRVFVCLCRPTTGLATLCVYVNECASVRIRDPPLIIFKPHHECMSVNEGLLISHPDSKVLSSFSLVSPPRSPSLFVRVCSQVFTFTAKFRNQTSSQKKMQQISTVIQIFGVKISSTWRWFPHQVPFYHCGERGRNKMMYIRGHRSNFQCWGKIENIIEIWHLFVSYLHLRMVTSSSSLHRDRVCAPIDSFVIYSLFTVWCISCLPVMTGKSFLAFAIVGHALLDLTECFQTAPLYKCMCVRVCVRERERNIQRVWEIMFMCMSSRLLCFCMHQCVCLWARKCFALLEQHVFLWHSRVCASVCFPASLEPQGASYGAWGSSVV